MDKNKLILSILISFLFCSLNAQKITAVYTIKNIKANSKSSDFGTSFFGPNRIFFASNKDYSKPFLNLRNLNETIEAPDYDLFRGIVMSTGEIDYVEKIKIPSSIKYNKTNAAFSPDMKYVYFTQNNIKDGKEAIDDKYGNVNMKIFRADVSLDGEWTNIISLPFNSNNYSCTHPSVSEDNKLLFFASNMPGTMGASDIYWVTINEDNTFGVPQNLGKTVNSKGRDNFPYVDKNILYFSSDRKDSQGGLDIYLVKLDEPGSKPVNIGSPINSKFDDLCFVIDRQNKRGYFSSNRPGGKGQDDIYYFTQDTEFKECKQLITGVVLDAETKKPISSAIVSLFSEGDVLISSITVSENGTFKFDLSCRDYYKAESYHFEYTKTQKEINFELSVFSQDIVLYLKPKPIVEENDVVKIPENSLQKPIKKENLLPTMVKNGKEMLDLPPVYFELDSYLITQDAEYIIKKAIKILEEHPEISVEFASHTDARASDSYNLLLSDLRAKEVVEYMVKRGIARERIIGRGYGESNPVNHCTDGVRCRESEHLQNRRAEFIIIKK